MTICSISPALSGAAAPLRPAPSPEPLRSSLIREARIDYPRGIGARLTDVEGGTAGFYGSVFGAVPYSFGFERNGDSFIVERAP